MDIESFTNELTARLVRAGADGSAARAEASAFVSSLPPEEAERIAAAGGNEAIMQRITDSLIRRLPARPSAAENGGAANGNNGTGVDGADDDYGDDFDDDIDEMLESSRPDSFPPAVQQRPQQRQVQQRPTAPGQVPAQQMPQPVQPQMPPPSQPMQQPQMPQQQMPSQMQPRQRQAVAPRPRRQEPAERPRRQTGEEQQKDRRIIYKPDPNADYRKFYIILACTSPIWGFAALLAAGLFLFAIGALSASILAIIAVIFVGVAVGTTLALVGIIYGITQLFEYAPIGMYEIGLGIMIGGTVMFAGVLAYNIAVRLVPYLIKKLMVLLSFTIHKCIELYYYVKGRCADL